MIGGRSDGRDVEAQIRSRPSAEIHHPTGHPPLHRGVLKRQLGVHALDLRILGLDLPHPLELGHRCAGVPPKR